jgi:hypothetical protein
MSTQKVLELQEQIRKSQQELDDIQKECKHDSTYHLAIYSWRVGAYNPSRICDLCSSSIPGIMEKETLQCLAENRSMYSDCDLMTGEVPEPLKEYENKYIAFTHNLGVIAVAETFEALYESVEKQGWTTLQGVEAMKVVPREVSNA